MTKDTGGFAYPRASDYPYCNSQDGMTLRDAFAIAALSNPALCDGKTNYEYELKAWFGDRTGITKQEIAIAQAFDYADAAIARRKE